MRVSFPHHTLQLLWKGHQKHTIAIKTYKQKYTALWHRTDVPSQIIFTTARVSFKPSLDSKQPKLVSALSETKRLFRLFRFYTETESFDVSIEPKQTKDQLKQFLLSQFKCRQYPIDVLRVTAPTGCSSQIDIFFIYNNQYHFANRALGYAMYCTVKTVCPCRRCSEFFFWIL
jgi:hypothetical protein